MPRSALVRYAGLTGSVLLAVAAGLGGARSPWRPTMTPGTIFAGRDGVLLPLAWLVGTLLLIGAWWVGRRVVPSARWAYVTAGLWAVPLLPFLPLGSYDVYSYACQGWQQAAGLDPYAGGVDLLGCPWRDAVAPTWLESPAPYGPVFLLLAAAAATVGGSLAGTVAALRVIALLGVALIAVCLPPLARRAGVPPSRAVWLTLACPLVPIHLVSGAHNDAVMVALLLAGLLLAATRRSFSAASGRSWLAAATRRSLSAASGRSRLTAASGRRSSPASGHPSGRLFSTASGSPLLTAAGRPWLAGALLGLAVGVKATAVVVLPFALLLVLRRPTAEDDSGLLAGNDPQPEGEVGAAAWHLGRSTGAAGKLLAGAGLVGGVVVALGGVSLLSGRGFGWVAGLAGSGVSVQWTALATAVGMAIDLVGPDAVPVTRVLGIVALGFVLGWLWWRARRGDVLLHAGYALGATVLLAPVFHPWYAVWALALLAATLRRETLWLTVPCAVASALCLPDGYNLALAVKTQGAVAVTGLLCYLGIKALKALNEAKNSRRLAAGHGHAADRLPGAET